ncbi:glucose dehydrogenase [Lysobacter helvus]|uniref:Glucose dehydrogenase n=2 Tax=Lysobacteraceae TaxID=32033 RepID=A0ABN6FPX5_9GAMM|nr:MULTISPECIES: hypothetical protein [Lysobacter]BCT91670.1 glucose dehydrogenase [Lysobacter caseinilyticus]BCT94823.1 glucose dehydrogenase [Lysobacter helvus]
MKQLNTIAVALAIAVAGLCPAGTRAQDASPAISVKLVPVVDRLHLVTDINVVGNWVFICTQPGVLMRKNLASLSTHDASVFLDIRPKVGMLGARIPALAGLGYPTPGTYDERGLLGFVADPAFATNGRFWIWYSNIGQFSNPPNFFQWTVSTTQPWNMARYDHVDYLDEYKVVDGVPKFMRTLLKLKRPYFNHTGFQSLVWSPEHKTLVLGLGDGGSEYDPNNIAQDDRQLSGKLIKIDLAKLAGMDFRNTAPVATFADLAARGVPADAFKTLVKGLRNPSKVHYEQTSEPAGDGFRWIKYLANTGQDTIEFLHGFDHYGINFGFRAWEGNFPTSLAATSDDPARTIMYAVEATHLPNYYRPLVVYSHLDAATNHPHANTGSALYLGDRIPGLKGDLVFIDWITFDKSPPQGQLMYASVNRAKLQRANAVHVFNVDLSAAGLTSTQPLFFTSINTDPAGKRLFVGGFKDFQFVVNQRQAVGSTGLGGALYEVVPK